MKVYATNKPLFNPLLLDDAAFIEHAYLMCKGKAVYSSRVEAKASLKWGNFKGVPYHCPVCREWHCHTQSSKFSRLYTRKYKDSLKAISTLEN